MKNIIALAALAALCACGQQGAKPADSTTTATSQATTTATPAAFELSCAAFANATGASLEQRYGATNVAQQNIPGAEGEEAPGTVLFPNDPARRVEIFWNDTRGRTSPSSITISGTEGQRSHWTGPHNLTLGESMTDVEHANGGAFTLYGFEWDYGGTVTDWRGGTLAPDDNCHVHVGFQPTGDAGRAAGDTAFRSDSAEMRAVHPYVSIIGVSFVGTPSGQSQQTDGK
ncbi:MAG: hypothetical protein WAU68_08825 [Vitreimonas sp.]